MAYPVYSSLFVSAHDLSSDTAYSWPFGGDGLTFVIVHMDGFMAGVGGGYVQAYDQNGTTFWHVEAASGGTGDWEQWTGRQVFHSGDTLFFIGSTIDPLGHLDFRVSGYTLEP